MAESLKIIHVCDHTVRTVHEEDKSSSVFRQELREDEVVDSKDSRFIYSGTWSYIKENDMNKYMETSEIGASITIHFYGDNFTLHSRKVPNGGIVKITIDGKEYGQFDLYNSLLIYNEPIIRLLNMPHGMHTILVEVVESRNENSTGNVLIIESGLIQDAFIVDTNPYEIIANGEVVKRINSVYQNIDGKINIFQGDKDYYLFSGNKIKWFSPNRPDPDYPYEIDYTRVFYKAETFKPSTCPRCYGLGWYGAFNNLTTGQPLKSLGIYKIAEDIIKILLTPLRDDGYGSNFLDMNKHLYTSASKVEEEAISEINRIERYYKSVQAEEMAKGSHYTAEDTLYAIIIDEVKFIADASKLDLVITVYNNVGQSHQAMVNI